LCLYICLIVIRSIRERPDDLFASLEAAIIDLYAAKLSQS